MNPGAFETIRTSLDEANAEQKTIKAKLAALSTPDADPASRPRRRSPPASPTSRAASGSIRRPRASSSAECSSTAS